MQKITFDNVDLIVKEIEKKFPADLYSWDLKNKKEINIRCPKCSDKKYHLGLSFSKNAYNCFRCPNSGRLTDFLKSYDIKFNLETRIISPEVNVEALKIKHPKSVVINKVLAKLAKKYLVDRGFDVHFLIQNFKLWPITDKNHYYFGYIIIYLNEYAFYARKYLNIKSLKNKEKHIIRKSDKNMKLFFSYEKNNSETLLVVESMFNLMKSAQFGVDAVCIFGKQKWRSLVEYIKIKNRTNLCLCFDKDVIIDNIESFAKQLYKNCGNINVSYIDPKFMTKNDIAMINDKKEFIKLIKNKKSVMETFIDSLDIGEIK